MPLLPVRPRGPLSALLVALVAACGDGTGPRQRTARVEILEGDAVGGVVATEVVVRARALDAGGRAVPNAELRWSARWWSPSCLAALGDTITRTDAQGVVTKRVTLPTAAGVCVVAVDGSVDDGAVRDSVEVRIQPDVPDSVLATPWGAGLAERPLPVTFYVYDRFGNIVPLAPLSFAVLAGGGAAPPAATSSEYGYVAASWTLGSAGPQELAVRWQDRTIGTIATTALADALRAAWLGGGSCFPDLGGALRCLDRSAPFSWRAVPAPPLTSVTTHGDLTYCGIADDARVFCGPQDGSSAASAPSDTLRLVSLAGSTIDARPYCGVDAAGGVVCLDSALRASAVAVPAPLVRLFDGRYSMCGVTAAGTGYCGVTSPSSTWRVPGDDRFVRLASFDLGHTGCGITTDGRLLCWGENCITVSSGGKGAHQVCGLIGLPATTPRTDVPAEVIPGRRFTALAIQPPYVNYAGSGVCALDTEGSVHCWNANLSGPDFRTSGGFGLRELVELRVLLPMGIFCAIDGVGRLFCWQGVHAPYPLPVPPA